MGAGGITGGTAAAAGASGRRLNKSLANWLVLRGQGAGEAHTLRVLHAQSADARPCCLHARSMNDTQTGVAG